MGCGSIGSATARVLKQHDKKLLLVDIDATKVEAMQDQDFDTVLADLNDTNLFTALDLSNIGSVLILSSDIGANKCATANARKAHPHASIIARASDSATKEELMAAGADSVFIPSRIVSNNVQRAMEHLESKKHGNAIISILKGIGDGTLGIVVHDNPDPDAMASAMALKEIAKSIDINAEVLYQGKIGHQENKAFVNLLNINMEQHKETSLSDYKKIALIDCAVPGENNLLPPDCTVSIIIDHHPIGEREVKAEFMDIQPNVGATATTMTKYLQELNLPISPELATALLYGIRTDTLEFKRNTTSADLTVAAFLYPLANHEMLNQISSPSMSTETLDILGGAIKNRQIKGSYLLTNVGVVRNRDALPQAADYLLNLEGIGTAICYGVSEDTIYISGRNKDIRVNLGETLHAAFGESDSGGSAGSAGGHAESAGAQIPLGVFSGASRETLMELAEEAVTKRFLEVVGIEVEDKEESEEKREKKEKSV